MNTRRSISGHSWIPPTASVEREGARFAQRHDIPLLVGNVLAAGGVTVEEVPAYLNPTLDELLPNSFNLTDMRKAAERLATAVRQQEPVGIFGDYDVDGACGIAMLVEWLRLLNVHTDFAVPHRVRTGFGPNVEMMQELAAEHPLIVTVDCGSAESAAEAMRTACRSGADIIVTDHHICGIEFPWVHTVVNPKRADDESGMDFLCGAGVIYLLLAATTNVLHESGWFTKEGVDVPDLTQWLDLVALATVVDVVPLQNLNRAFVKHGLAQMMKRSRPGLVKLADAANARYPITESTLGFMIGPHLNAPGRIGEDSTLATRLLLARDELEADELAMQCVELNQRRRALQQQCLDEAVADLDARDVDGTLVWAAKFGWHPGVVGVVAGQLVTRQGKPTIVLAEDDDCYRGSGRSLRGYDLGAAIQTAVAEGVLRRGGGHAMAVGLEVATDRLGVAMARIDELLAAGKSQAERGAKEISYLGPVTPTGVNWELYEALANAGPYGHEFRKPRFVMVGVEVVFVKSLNNGHYKLDLHDGSGGRAKALAFSTSGVPLGEALASMRRGTRVDLLGTIEPDTYNDARRAYFRIEDLAI